MRSALFCLSVFALFFSSCCCNNKGCYYIPFFSYDKPYPVPPPKRQLVDIDVEDISEIILTYAHKLKVENRLHLEQSFACYDQYINKVRLQFISQDLLEMDEARELLVDVVEGLLERLNNNYTVARARRSETNPALFTAGNIEISINFESYYGLYLDPFYVGWVLLNDGQAYYYAFDIYEQKRDCWHYRSEPYFKSRSFVNIERKAKQDYERAHPKKDSALKQDQFESSIPMTY